jgi:hypothetical protein
VTGQYEQLQLQIYFIDSDLIYLDFCRQGGMKLCFMEPLIKMTVLEY